MKRINLIKHLSKNGCALTREGAEHSVFFNEETKHTSTILRHKEINSFLAKKICRDLGVDEPKKI